MSNPVTRRTALKQLALAGAGLPLLGVGEPLQAAGGTPPSGPSGPLPFHFGVASYSLRSLPFENALQAVRRLGLDRISINPRHIPWENSPPGWTTQLTKLKEVGVEATCVGVIYLKNDETQMRRAFDYVRTMGVPVFSCGPEPAALPLLERFVKEYDVRAAIHNHGPENKDWPSPHEIWRAVGSLDSRIGLCIDVGHTYRAGADPVDCIRRYRERLYDVHLKDTVAAVGADDTPIEVGRGRLDQRAMLSALIGIGYRHNVFFEFEKDANDPMPGLAESVGYIRGLLKGMEIPLAAA